MLCIIVRLLNLPKPKTLKIFQFHICVHMHTVTYKQTHPQIQVYTHTHTHTQSHSHKNTHRHIYTHTFTSLHHFSTRTPHRYKANCLSSAIFRFPFFSLKEGTMISFSHIRKITLKPLTLAK